MDVLSLEVLSRGSFSIGIEVDLVFFILGGIFEFYFRETNYLIFMLGILKYIRECCGVVGVFL